MSRVEVRPAVADDFEAIRAIYAEAVLNTTASFELEPPSVDEMKARHDRLVGAGYPYRVAAIEGSVAGYCYAGPFRDRPAYRYTVESSVYVDASCRRRGVARALLEALIRDCTQRGFHRMLAVIGGGQNHASIGFHERMGFEPVGTLREVGRKFDEWQDVVLMQRDLDPGR